MSQRVALVQLVSGSDVDRNLRDSYQLLKRAADEGATLVVLPENFAFMGATDTERVAHAEAPGSGRVQTFLSDTAQKLAVTIVGGTVPLTSNDTQRPYSACLVFDPAGEQIARYDKIHLFDVALPDTDERYLESASTSPGGDPVVVETALGRLGLAVCYDLRFPELFRMLMARGAEIVAVPSAFTATTGAAHWEILVRARALENLVMIVAADQGGRHANGRVTHGHSMIVDCWGQILGKRNSGPGVVCGDWQRDRQRRLRDDFGALKARRIPVQ